MFVSSELLHGPDKIGNYVVEASVLGLKPGVWPEEIRTTHKKFCRFSDQITDDGEFYAVAYLDGLGRIDLTGALILKGLVVDARAAGLVVEMHDVPPQAKKIVQRVLASHAPITPLAEVRDAPELRPPRRRTRPRREARADGATIDRVYGSTGSLTKP